MSALEVRAARPEDADAIVSLMQEAHVFHASALPHVFAPVDACVATADDVRALASREDRVFLVASDHDRLLGYAHAEVVRAPATPYKRAIAELHVHAMAVTERARRRGVGSALVRALREAAAERALRDVTLEVYAFNDAARAFYLREGFAPLRQRLTMPVASTDAMTTPTTDAAPDHLLARLAGDRATLLAQAERVPRARWGERPSPDRWSVVEILEHVARVDTSVTRMLALRAAEPVWASAEELESARLTPRKVEWLREPSHRVSAPDRVLPKGSVAPDAAVDHLATTRAALESAYRAADPAALDGMLFPHPFLGPLTLRGWIEMAAHHDARHARQIAEIADGWGAERR